MTLYPLGLLIAFAAIWTSTYHLETPLSSFYDYVALAMVVGGTFAVGVVIIPWSYRFEIWLSFKTLFVGVKDSRQDTLKASMDFVHRTSNGEAWSQLPNQHLGFRILNDGAEMISLGLDPDKIENILRERVYQWGKRSRRVANSLRNLAKYPPAFGLAGTVLGLMQLMRAISGGLDARETGLLMAIALVATLYGILVSNMIINPAGEACLKRTVTEEEAAEIAVTAVRLGADRASLVEAQEVLNSFVSDDMQSSLLDKVDYEAAA